METLYKILNLIPQLRCKNKSYDFRIKGGSHFSGGGGFLNVSEPEIKFNINFNEYSDVYIVNNPRQINKAIGLKEGIYGNKNSVLLGFSTYNNKFELWMFVNHNNKFEHIKLGDFDTDTELGPFTMGIRENEYYLEFQGEKYSIQRNGGKVPSIVGMVRTYFGGKLSNPKENGEIQVKINIG